METFASFDGVEIAYTVAGAGPDALLMHGFASNAQNNWFGPGVADKIVASGRRVIAYDARGHGVSVSSVTWRTASCMAAIPVAAPARRRRATRLTGA